MTPTQQTPKPEGPTVDTQYCIVEKQNHVMTVRLNRPERLNAMHPPANIELGHVFDDFEADNDMWVAVITGEGRGFCAGNDLRYQAEGGRRDPMPRGFGGLSWPAISSSPPTRPCSPCPNPRSDWLPWPAGSTASPAKSARSGPWA